MSGSTRHASIAGAGIGGLTAALCLRAAGWDVEVFEAAPKLEEVGAGLQLSPNATRVMRALGLEDALREVAFEPEALELRLGQSGQRIFSIPAGAAAEARWGAPYLHIHRADLQSVLADALEAREPGSLHLSTPVSGYALDGARPMLVTAVGDTKITDLIVAADGIHSTIRHQMLGPAEPRFTGNLAWRATVPLDRLDTPPPPTACVWAGRGRHAVTYRVRGGRLANFVGVVERSDWTGESWTQEGSREDALADFEGWDPVVTELITKADSHYRWALYDRAPLPRWSDGPVILLGDACHPMLPFMAQGAAMAIEDAYVLAALLRHPHDTATALQRHQSIRLPRTRKMQAASRANMKTFHRRTAAMRLATYGPMWLAGQLLPGFVNSRQDWIYGYDVTAMDR